MFKKLIFILLVGLSVSANAEWEVLGKNDKMCLIVITDSAGKQLSYVHEYAAHDGDFFYRPHNLITGNTTRLYLGDGRSEVKQKVYFDVIMTEIGRLIVIDIPLSFMERHDFFVIRHEDEGTGSRFYSAGFRRALNKCFE